ncbi:hypothetical protein [Thermocrinis sp.]|uniref:hypothetical protein n=1 Tax=Thermocrinis sp. TaxID=2024383 RepID=UPI002FDDB77F
MVEIRSEGIVECMTYFSEAKELSKDFIYGGLFWTGSEEYIKNFSIILHKLINREKQENLKKELDNVLRYPDYRLKGRALYDKDKVIWKKSWDRENKLRFYRFRKNEKINLVSGRVVDTSKIDNRAGLVFLKLLGVEGGTVDREKLFYARKEVVRVWESLTKDQRVKEYLARVRRVGKVISELYPEGTAIPPSILKLFGYIASFDFKSFGDSLLLSRARLFQKKKKAEELLQEVETLDKNAWEDFIYYLENKEGISKEEFLKFLKRLEDENFLFELRKDWKEFLKDVLKKESKDFFSVFVAKSNSEEGKISYGEFHSPCDTIKLFVFYEDTLKDKVKDFMKGFEKVANALEKYIGNAKIIFAEKVYPIERLIYKFNELKNKDMEKLRHEDSVELLLSLMDFACKLKLWEAYGKKNKEIVSILILLDTDVRQENGGYSFWDYFSFIYDFFGLPVQTLNRPTIEEIISANSKQLTGLFKNLFISLLKDYKSLNLEFEGFNLPSKLNIYAILEKPSVSFCYKRGDKESRGSRHFLYEVYLIDINENNAKVELLDKRILLTSGVDAEKQRFRKWLEEKVKDQQTKFCFITAGSWEESYLEEVINLSEQSQSIRSKSLFVEYAEFPTAYVSDKAQKDCFVIYTSEFEKLKEKLKIRDDRYSAALALKPAEPGAIERFKLANNELYFHSALQVFSTKGPGWEKEEVYAEEKSLFLFTVLALSFYQSEAFQTPYSKLDLWQRKKTHYLKIKRNYHEYTFPLNAVLYELIYLVSKIPEEESVPGSES